MCQPKPHTNRLILTWQKKWFQIYIVPLYQCTYTTDNKDSDSVDPDSVDSDPVDSDWDPKYDPCSRICQSSVWLI